VPNDEVLDAVLAARLVAMASERPAVVFERLPRAAGRTRWFYCDTAPKLTSTIGQLVPASRVSFYFDGRISVRPVDDAVREAAQLLAEHHGIVLGMLATDGVEIETDFPSSAHEVNEQLALTGSASVAFIGPFPGPENDGHAAITAVVPDADGSVRHEPH
jgi:hypothetical protein